jgi:hypothetical protein
MVGYTNDKVECSHHVPHGRPLGFGPRNGTENNTSIQYRYQCSEKPPIASFTLTNSLRDLLRY